MNNISMMKWDGLFYTAIVGIFSYVVLIIFLRLSGKRTLSKLNAFDLIVNISLGSILASIILNDSVPVTEGLCALAVLIVLQFIVTWTSVRVGWVRRFVTGEPEFLVRDGLIMPSSLKRARVTEDEVHAAVRSAGIGDLGLVTAVIIETDGSLSVIKGGMPSGVTTMGDVKDRSSVA